jgi:hypothetical protein
LKKDGRFKFQVDLGIALLNYAIGAEWDDLSKPRPEWMRSQDWVPCDCGACFFCLNGLTNGIIHKSKRKIVTTFTQHDKTRTKQKGCTDQRINLGRHGSYCKMCYRKLCASTDEKIKALNTKAKKKQCNSSKMGCPSCDEHICKGCWDEGYDVHMKKQSK